MPRRPRPALLRTRPAASAGGRPSSAPPAPRAATPLAPLLAGLAVALLTGCATPKREAVRETGRSRSTPRGTYEYLRDLVKAEQPEMEWATYSPAFKRRLSQQVGRTIDVGDYVQARSTVATNRRKEIQLFLESEFASERADGEDASVVTIRAGNRQARPRFVRLTTWSLHLKGEGQPVAEFVPTTADVIQISPTGQVEMRIAPSEGTASFLRDVPQDRISGFEVHEYWYLDDFGGIEAAVLGGLRGEGSAADEGRGGTPDARPPPGSGRSRDRLPPPPPPPSDPWPDFGSPDGPPPGAGVGSPG